MQYKELPPEQREYIERVQRDATRHATIEVTCLSAFGQTTRESERIIRNISRAAMVDAAVCDIDEEREWPAAKRTRAERHDDDCFALERGVYSTSANGHRYLTLQVWVERQTVRSLRHIGSQAVETFVKDNSENSRNEIATVSPTFQRGAMSLYPNRMLTFLHFCGRPTTFANAHKKL